MSKPETKNLLNLPRGTIVTFKGRIGRIRERYLDPNRKPGLGRVSYDFEPALVSSRTGDLSWGMFALKRVRAAAIEGGV